MHQIFDSIFKKYINLKSLISKDGKKHINKVIKKGENFTQKGKLQIEIERLKWELKVNHTSLGKYISNKNIENKMSDFTHDNFFLNKVHEIYKLEIFIKDRKNMKSEI